MDGAWMTHPILHSHYPRWTDCAPITRDKPLNSARILGGVNEMLLLQKSLPVATADDDIYAGEGLHESRRGAEDPVD